MRIHHPWICIRAGGVAADSPPSGNIQGAAAVAGALKDGNSSSGMQIETALASASSSAQDKSNLETLMESAMPAAEVYVKFVDFMETVNPSASRIQEFVKLYKLNIEKQTAAAYHAIRSHSATVFDEHTFNRLWIGAYQWGVEQPIKGNYACNVVILDERLNGHEQWEGKEAFCRWFAVLLDNKFKSYQRYHYQMAGASQLRANQAYPAYRVLVVPQDGLRFVNRRTALSFFKSQHHITSKTQLTLASEYLAQVSSRYPGLIPSKQRSNRFAAFTPLPNEWIEKEFKSILIEHPDLEKAIHIGQPGCWFRMVNDLESANMPVEHMGDLTSILGSHVYSIALDAHKSINSYGELLLRKPTDPIRVAFEEKHAWRFLHVLSSINVGMQKGLFNNNIKKRMVNLMKSTIEKLESGANKGKGEGKDGKNGGNKTTDTKQAQRETAPHSLQTVLPPPMPSHFPSGPFRGRGGFRARGYSYSRPYDGGRERSAPPRSDDFDGFPRSY
ncbi:unnamed protein product [Vitrella brassicaformis CCMP3155]|uniref:Uncharacterized protein n=1 Tax=Vitrella brassicaformis (strain CCMP3155) TaxID=1169540 RepID=A0A0G4FCW1_VITBC|nr:unnamed protein product [Vitrella brassicaformis CCMP3155]|eukprot:CEM11011.1 unnamed protein product [Vitrella brassicaformis CCMP3155]